MKRTFVAVGAFVLAALGTSIGVYLAAREWRDKHYKARYAPEGQQ